MRWLNLEYIFYTIYNLILAPFSGEGEGSAVLSVLVSILLLVGVASLVFLIYCIVKWRELYTQSERLKTNLLKEKQVAEKEEKSEEWTKIEKLVNSDNPSDWKIAVMEADKMLDKLTIDIGLSGETLGERLKGADLSSFTTLQSAWEAHKLRNRIAHEAAHVLTRREARRATTLFEEVFREFGVL